MVEYTAYLSGFWNFLETFHDGRISFARATQLQQQNVRPVHAPNLASVGRKFEEDLQQVLKEGFPLFSGVDLRAEQRLKWRKL